MTIVAAQLAVKVGGDTKEAESALGRVNDQVKESGGFFKNALSSALGFAAGTGAVMAVGAAFGFVKDQIGDVIKAGMDQQAVMSQTEAVLKSTGDASGFSAKQINDMADALAHTTTFSDDTIQSAENMLLTFTNIKGTLPDATKTVLDMSQALGQDTKSSAIQLGKALNDPLTGITALQRVGVTFDAQQKALIKTYMQHGDVASAQGIILKELQKEFGGSAEAAGTTFAGKLQILNNTFDQVKEKIGLAILPLLTQLLTKAEPLIAAIGDALPGALDTAGRFFSQVWTAAQPFVLALAAQLPNVLHTLAGIFTGIVVPAFHLLVTVFQAVSPLALALWRIFSEQVLPVARTLATAIGSQLAPIIADLQHAFAAASPFIAQLGDALTTLAPIVGLIAAVIGTNLAIAIGVAIGVIRGLIAAFSGVMQMISGVAQFLAGIFQIIVGIFTGNGDLIHKGWDTLWNGVKNIIQGAINAVLGFVGGFFGGLMGWFDRITGGGLSKIGNFIGGIVQWFRDLPGKVVAEIANLEAMLGNAFQNMINSAFDWGKHLISGFIDGIKNMANAAKDAAGNVISGIGNVLGFHSPAKEGPGAEADTWAPNLMAMFTGGILAAVPHVQRAASLAASAVHAGLSGIGTPALAMGSSASFTPSVGALPAGTSGGITVVYQVDGRTLARQLLPHMVNEIRLKTGVRQ